MSSVARLTLPALIGALSAISATSVTAQSYYYPGPVYRSYEAPPRYYGYREPYERMYPGDRREWYAPRYTFRPYDRNERRRPQYDDDDDDKPRGPKVLDGGARPDIRPIGPQTVPFNGSYAPGTIVIDTGGRQLLLITSERAALRYPISVGRQGFTWTGTEKISRIADWPDWHPPAEMRERQPELPEKMTGGLKNPLGAKALYLGNSLYRIHGTNDARTVGQASSSGCFRMLNGHVIDLASRVSVGTTVVVVNRLPRGSMQFSER